MFTVVDDVGRLASKLGHHLTGSRQAIEPSKKGRPDILQANRLHGG
jgi:hypothetical protein